MTDAVQSGERIAKYLARAGVASRREIERMIEGGRVKVDGKTLDTPAFKVTGQEVIIVDGITVETPEATRLWLYHKPAGLVTTHSDPEGRETVFDKIPKEIGRVISIGRLDLTSEGLLLLTNDGALARALELPSTGWTRRYRARAFGTIDNAAIAKLQAGITVEGIKYGPMEVDVERETGSNIWLTIGIKEGKNREVRRALDAVGLRVNRLIRIAYGPFQLGTIDRGEVKSIASRILKDQCGHLMEPGHVFEELAAASARPAKRPAKRTMGGAGQPGFAKPVQFLEDSNTRGPRSRPDPKRADSKRPDSKRPDSKRPDSKRGGPKRADPRDGAAETAEPKRGEGRKFAGKAPAGSSPGGKPKTGFQLAGKNRGAATKPAGSTGRPGADRKPRGRS
ncbi:pseudouridine synthase [Maricaulis sp.]|uniref:pseudouridine synthase n=1 Tax=Maricaulis sp. TaxID=1486257 RepID=UPI003A92004E